ncbi:protein phosphatase 2C-related protein [Tieghemostelium lacteum]|uniref:Protein phosphatase 2C-related protein n=1 Tax=Tieghemostelium lacteum TaxID=361077 RepID=A0A151ZEJ5_TIELA|nr:protein phosphatase 2C-related protein [Tieghemostelium lacteum]|eukprot:KYQ92378.1 protein phosphatase 2C-related protein [Tieghemostelium lacteum]
METTALKEDEAQLIISKLRDLNTGIYSKFKGLEYFKSHQIVDWLTQNLQITRSKAVECGQMLWDRGVFEVVGYPFGDNDQLIFIKPPLPGTEEELQHQQQQQLLQWSKFRVEASSKDMLQADPIYKLHKSIAQATKLYQNLLKEKKQCVPPNTHLGLKLLDICLNLIMSNQKPNPNYYNLLVQLQDFATLPTTEEKDNAYLNPSPIPNTIPHDDHHNSPKLQSASHLSQQPHQQLTNQLSAVLSQQPQQQIIIESLDTSLEELLSNSQRIEKSLLDQINLIHHQSLHLKKLLIDPKVNSSTKKPLALTGNTNNNNNNQQSTQTTIYPNGFGDQSTHTDFMPNLSMLERQRSSGSIQGIDLAPVVIGSVQNQFPKFYITDSKNDSFITTVNGPPMDALESTIHSCFNQNFYARTISTYPHLPGHPKRDGDPICDHYCVQIQSSRVIAAVADGCSWGVRPAEAATRASISFVDFMSKALSNDVQTVQDAGNHILSAFNYAHNKIIEGKTDIWDAGTTTLIGGVLIELQQKPSATSTSGTNNITDLSKSVPLNNLNNNNNKDLTKSTVNSNSGNNASGNSTGKDPNTPPTKWGFICASVGDCKAFHYSHSSKKFTDITKNNRGNADDPKDPGGRLGPYVANGQPDLRNLCLHFLPCNENDIIFLVSDGAHDNFDPQTMGLLPKDLSISGYENWSDIESLKAQDAKAKYTSSFLKQKLFEGGEINPKFITERIMNHCTEITKSSREFMENNPNKPLPDNMKEYKGKMDHCTVLSFRVGKQLL